MPRAMSMGTLEAIQAIANGLIGLTDRRDYQHRKFPFPSIEQFSPEKPSFLVRWEGIAADEPTESELIVAPSLMRFAVRIINIYNR